MNYLICKTCRKKHRMDSRPLMDQVSDWNEKHIGHDISIKSARPSFMSFEDNTDQKQAFQTEQSMTVTNLHSLASSATAGWGSAAVDNSTNLYQDALVAVHIAAVNTAPGSNKAIYVYAYGSTDGAIWTSTGTSGGTVGTEGALTFPSIATPLPVLMPLIGVIPYPVQNKALDGGPFSVAKAFGGVLPRSWGVAILNYSGFTFAASGNTVKYQGVYYTG